MLLFHSSFQQLSILEPKLGPDRHKGEDERAVGKDVIYFTTAEDEIHRKNNIVFPFRYTVEIDEHDPDLSLDEKDLAFRQEGNEEFDLEDDTRWYFFIRPIKVLETAEWDGEKYIKRPNF